MTKDDEALARLRELKALSDQDPEMAHVEADQVLLKLINNDEITEAFEAIWKWYA